MDTIKLLLSDKKGLTAEIEIAREHIVAESIFSTILLTQSHETDDNYIKLVVPNSVVAREVIIELFDKARTFEITPENVLDVFQCKKYFGLATDISILEETSIIPEKFGQLLDLVENMELNDKIMHIIIKNLPKDYDLQKIPQKLLHDMLDVMNNDKIVVCVGVSYKVKKFIVFDRNKNSWDIYDTFPFKASTEVFCSSENTRFYFQNGKIIFVDHSESITFYFHVDNKPFMKCYRYLENNTFAYADSNGIIRIYSIGPTSELLKEIPAKGNFNSLIFSPDNKYAITGSYDGEISVWDTENGSCVTSVRLNEKHVTNMKIIVKLSFLNKEYLLVVSHVDVYIVHFGVWLKYGFEKATMKSISVDFITKSLSRRTKSAFIKEAKLLPNKKLALCCYYYIGYNTYNYLVIWNLDENYSELATGSYNNRNCKIHHGNHNNMHLTVNNNNEIIVLHTSNVISDKLKCDYQNFDMRIFCTETCKSKFYEPCFLKNLVERWGGKIGDIYDIFHVNEYNKETIDRFKQAILVQN